MSNENEPPTIINDDAYSFEENSPREEVVFNILSLPDYNDPSTYRIEPELDFESFLKQILKGSTDF